MPPPKCACVRDGLWKKNRCKWQEIDLKHYFTFSFLRKRTEKMRRNDYCIKNTVGKKQEYCIRNRYREVWYSMTWCVENKVKVCTVSKQKRVDIWIKRDDIQRMRESNFLQCSLSNKERIGWLSGMTQDDYFTQGKYSQNNATTLTIIQSDSCLVKLKLCLKISEYFSVVSW